MAITHHFVDRKISRLAGRGSTISGKSPALGHGTWAKEELTVTSGTHGKQFDLGQHGHQNFTEAKLRGRLPRLAI